MKLALDELLTYVDASQIRISEKNPLSPDRIIQNTISRCNVYPHERTHCRRRIYLLLTAAILVGLLAATALAATIAESMKTVTIEYQVSDEGEILSPEVPDLGIRLSVSNVSPTGMDLTGSVGTTRAAETICAGSGYYLEAQTDSGWEAVPMLCEHQWQWDDQKLDGGQYLWQIDWTDIYGALASGRYRIQKGFTVISDDGTFKIYFICEEFILGG